jgi:4-hydroxybenzoate polyprenyltransferase
MMRAYSMRLKDIAIVDVFTLAMGYTLRILAGSLAVDIDVSPWLLVFSAALFFGLALLKRYAELVCLHARHGAHAKVRAYRVDDAAMIAGLGIAFGGIAVAVLALYPVVDPTGHARWPVWVVSGLLLFWTGHMWLMAHHGEIHDDPVSYALRDHISRVFGVLIGAVLLVSP